MHGFIPVATTTRASVSGDKGSGAWCTASASVYNAARNWNNVYVHSNQPNTEATASADGYSHSYETDGSGYALIYLNGPPPGAQITVTVGGATCRTSDLPVGQRVAGGTGRGVRAGRRRAADGRRPTPSRAVPRALPDLDTLPERAVATVSAHRSTWTVWSRAPW